MKILMLNYEFPPLGGGTGNANYYLLKEFAKAKSLSVDLVTSSATNRFEVDKFSKNINIFKLNVHKKDIHFWKTAEIVRWISKAFFYSKKLVLDNKYDVCHCWSGWPSGVLGFLFRKKVPYIVSLRGSDVPGYNPRLQELDRFFFRPLSRIVWAKADIVTANSEGLKELALKTMPADIDVIYNSVDIQEFKPKRKNIGKSIRLISTGRLIKRKGYDCLIKAMVGLNHCELLLIGKGDQEKNLKKLARDLKVNVIFKGYIAHQQIPAELRNSDIFVLPSLNEGMSNSLLEAMACGLPIITTDTGGSKELIDNNGIVVPKQSVAALRDAIIQIQPLIEEYGRQSRRRVENMSWHHISVQYMEKYRDIPKSNFPKIHGGAE